MKKNIAVLPGDGIGPEIIQEAVKILDAVAKAYDHDFHIPMQIWALLPLTKQAVHCPKLH